MIEPLTFRLRHMFACACKEPAEAADRIEKLEAALREIANFDLYGDYSNAYEIQPIARKALDAK
jgi:hypothetical protein